MIIFYQLHCYIFNPLTFMNMLYLWQTCNCDISCLQNDKESRLRASKNEGLKRKQLIIQTIMLKDEGNHLKIFKFLKNKIVQRTQIEQKDNLLINIASNQSKKEKKSIKNPIKFSKQEQKTIKKLKISGITGRSNYRTESLYQNNY